MVNDFIYPTQQSIELHNQINRYLVNNEPEKALEIIDSVISEKIKITNTILEISKIDFASRYLDVVDILSYSETGVYKCESLINKAFGIFNQNERVINEILQVSLGVKKNRARGYMLLFDVKYFIEQIEQKKPRGPISEIKSIYHLKDALGDAIKYYWEALKAETIEDEKYNIRNNLALLFLRTGRYVEAITLFEQNISLLPHRWQSNASLADALYLLVENSFIPETASLFCVMAENYFKLSNIPLSQTERGRLENFIKKCEIELKQMGHALSDSLLKENRVDEKAEFEKHTEYRKYVLRNNLSISEHALYCKCSNTIKDNLKIGTLGGSLHLSKKNILQFLDGLVNRLLSEFAYARLLYYQYMIGNKILIDDIEFSNISNNDLLGYDIEQIRTSYRIAYSILDKIGNGILELYEIEKIDNRSYFENVFDIYKDKFSNIQNIHLTALYSMALDLNRESGSLRHFKNFRNEMEHGYLAVIDKTNLDSLVATITEQEIKKFTFDLLQLTRAAIFSFVFLIRSKTVVKTF